MSDPRPNEKRSRKTRRTRFEQALCDLLAAVSRLERQTGGQFKFHLSWEPPVNKPAPEKDRP